MARYNPIPPQLTEQHLEQFWELVTVADLDECWPWNGRHNGKGYGLFSENGFSRLAHRVAYFLDTGMWPLLDVLHRCDTPPCCNPTHFFTGTQADNMKDAANKGRLHVPRPQRQGILGPTTKLTEPQVLQIRALAAQGLQLKEIAQQFPISLTTVANVVHRRQWKHL